RQLRPGEAPPSEPGMNATVLSREEGRVATSDGRTSILLIEPWRVHAKTIGLGYARYEAASMPGQTHSHGDLEEAIYVLSGNGQCWLGSEIADIEAGQAVDIPPGAPHRVEVSGPSPLEFLLVYSPPRGAWYQGEYPPEL
ncbi:MAG: cupin domain-containing protein, partial [Candidatus Bathyarchaeia archaeon]